MTTDDEFEIEHWDRAETMWIVSLGAIVAVWSVVFVVAVLVVTK